jgi:hypothetical protein
LIALRRFLIGVSVGAQQPSYRHHAACILGLRLIPNFSRLQRLARLG